MYISNSLKSFPLDDIAFFCGSGISLDAPSCLPKWDNLCETALKHLCVASNNTYYDLLRSKLDLYIFTQVALERMEGTSDLFCKIFSAGKPNANHLAIARFCKDNDVRIIITTNFDNLIEQALEIEGVAFEVIVGFDDLISHKIEKLGHLQLIKIHGSADNPTSIIGSFKSIHRFNFTLQATKAFEPIFQNYKIVFVGYSGADFRVNRNYLNILSAAPLARGIIWNFYSEDDSSTGNIMYLKKKYGERFQVLYGSVSDLLNIRTKDGDEAKKISDAYNYEPSIENWIKTNSVSRRYFCLSALLEWCDAFEEAYKMYQNGLKHLDRNSTQELNCQIFFSIGENLQKLEKPVEALSWFKEAYKQCLVNGFPELANRALLGIAVSELLQGNFDQAIPLLNNVKRYANAVNDKELFLDAINHVGIVYTGLRMPKQAALILEECIQKRLEMGDFYKALSSKQNLASAYQDMGRIDEALDLLKEAVEEYEKYDIQLDLCIASVNYGYTLGKAGRKLEAKMYLEKGLELSEKLKNRTLYQLAKSSLEELE